MTRLFFHVDLDAFFASAEQIDFPDYAGKPVIVGAMPGHRGVVSACSYEARAFGVHSAMPINEAVRLCPQGIFLPVRMDRYQELSSEVFSVFADFTPQVERISIDEAFLDMTGTERLFGPARQAALSIKERVKELSGLTISVGAAHNRFLAKLASARSKPNGLLVVDEGGEEAFMDGLPLGRLWGAGEKTQERLRELNIRSVRQLRGYEEGLLKGLFGQAMGAFLYAACRGMDCGMGEGGGGAKSISTERTFEYDIHDQESLEAVLIEAAQDLMYQLYSRGMQACTVIVKLRYGDFTTVSVRRTLRVAVSSSEQLYRIAIELFREKREAGKPVRLLGLGVTGMEEGMETQGELFDQAGARSAKVEKAVFGLKRKGAPLRKARTFKENPDDTD